MAEQRTEEATPKKLRDARAKGEVPRSRELGTAAVVLAATGALAATGGAIVEALRACFATSLRVARGELGLAPGALLETAAALAAGALAPLLAAVVVAAFLASFLQVGAVVTVAPVTPKLERLDPVRGLRNLLAPRQLAEVLKSLAKIAVVGWIAWAVLRDATRGVVGLAAREPGAALDALGAVGQALLLRVGLGLAAIAVLDVLLQRWQFRRDQRMTKDEVRREHKESEGDPHAKQERERAHREVLAQSALEAVRRADVLVVNPTHLAVALRYDATDDDAAPEVVAKGEDVLARRMIDAAREAGVPVLRDVPLAHALHALETGDVIPEPLYDAVAAVLHAAWAEREASEDAP